MAAPTASAVTSFIASSAASNDPASTVAAQVLHNLQHQHLWTDLKSHDAFTLSSTQHAPLILGRPPQTVYTHPDEQAYMVQYGIKVEDVPVENEWVLPTAQGQTWSLRRLAGIFDALPDRDAVAEASSEALRSENPKLAEFYKKRREEGWNVKRLLLAMINTGMGGDGTVVYYVVLEGAIKPRQN
ncbi:tRNA-splicing endonuclease subunit Sen15 [Ascosphaera apis ARSEF 7405]|uniref:tRNA-splicing endonuclease subunit Sen15 n=1 Tax=Ascosphaera apis ARSEF 7405 TaxID=392613 RepID=A0A168DNA2_9EURO|nr:tRNA-splicing endonuclease subunit Sen15 [Ascosphaera apis ARSEF 7405]